MPGWKACLLAVSFLMPHAPLAFASDDGCLASLSFDEKGDQGPFEMLGPVKYVPGVEGKGILLDGYTTHVRCRAEAAPVPGNRFSITAWVAPQEYPWNWCGIANQERDHEAGWFFGVDHVGCVGLMAAIGGEWKECISEERIPLLRWSHIAGVFDSAAGITVYVNGRPSGHLRFEGSFSPAKETDLLLGMSLQKMYPVHTERAPSRKLLSNMIFDGILDEVRIYGRALTADEMARDFARVRPETAQPLEWRAMPSGHGTGPAGFGAAYGRLRYGAAWERLWRVGPHPDILVRFDTSPVRLVFWRGTNFGPAWVTENNLWMGDQSLESGSAWGCNEHMSDKQCRYAHVRLIENHDARVVVHWRYALCDIRYEIVNTDETGWGDWADEYYTVYPDAVAVRRQVLWSTSYRKNWHQFQETILFNQPGHRPEDTVEMEALTLVNMDGDTHTYSWAEGYPGPYDRPESANIQMINFRARYRPFTIFEEGSRIWPFRSGALEGYSTFPCWNHWPVAQLPNDGRNAPAPDRPSHTSLTGGEPKISEGEGISKCAVYLYGMTKRSAAELAPLARSWNRAPALEWLGGEGFFECYDKTERAYVLVCRHPGAPGEFSYEIAASKASPLVNPAFVIRNWGEAGASLKIDGEEIPRGKAFRFGHRHRMEGSDLVVWVELESEQPVELCLSPAE